MTLPRRTVSVLPAEPPARALARRRRWHGWHRPGQRRRLWIEHLPTFAIQLARGLRSGTPVETALTELIEETSTTPPPFSSLASELRAGRPIDDALVDLHHAVGSDPERLLALAISTCSETGAPMAPVLEGVAASLRDEVDLDARRRVLLIQAQLSAAVLVALPVLFLTVSSLARGSWPLSGVSGVVLLSSGIFMDGMGVLWMKRLLRGLR